MMFHRTKKELGVFERDLFNSLSIKEWISTATLQAKVPSKIGGIHYRILTKLVERGVLESRMVQGHQTREREWKLKWRAEP